MVHHHSLKLDTWTRRRNERAEPRHFPSDFESSCGARVRVGRLVLGLEKTRILEVEPGPLRILVGRPELRSRELDSAFASQMAVVKDGYTESSLHEETDETS